jgi:REP element-mobilizing transposase RayT
MIIAYHAIFTTYGTWLPNDPRGSYSKKIYNEDIEKFGEIKYGRQTPPPKSQILKFYSQAVSALNKDVYLINDFTRPVIAGAFAKVVKKLNIKVPACAIMNDHVHILILRSNYSIEYLVNQLKGVATKELNLRNSPWTRGFWKVFIDSETTLVTAIKYVNNNPAKAGLSPQIWSFVKS